MSQSETTVLELVNHLSTSAILEYLSRVESWLYNKIKTCLRLPLLVLIISFSLIDFWNTSDTESEVDLQLSTGGMDQDDDDFDFYGWITGKNNKRYQSSDFLCRSNARHENSVMSALFIQTVKPRVFTLNVPSTSDGTRYFMDSNRYAQAFQNFKLVGTGGHKVFLPRYTWILIRATTFWKRSWHVPIEDTHDYCPLISVVAKGRDVFAYV